MPRAVPIPLFFSITLIHITHVWSCSHLLLSPRQLECAGENISPQEKLGNIQQIKQTKRQQNVKRWTFQLNNRRGVYTQTHRCHQLWQMNLFMHHTATHRIWPEGVLCRGAEEFTCTHMRSVLHSSFVLCKNCRTRLHPPHVEGGSHHWAITIIFTDNFTNEETKNRKTFSKILHDWEAQAALMFADSKLFKRRIWNVPAIHKHQSSHGSWAAAGSQWCLSCWQQDFGLTLQLPSTTTWNKAVGIWGGQPLLTDN